MAIAYVRDLGKIRTTGTGLASSASFGTAPAVGNHVISMIGCYKGGDTTYSMTTSDNKSNSYSNAVTARDPYSGGETISNIASAKVATSSGTFTVTATASGSGVAYHTWSAAEFSGLHATTWLDRTGSATGAIGTNALAITVTTSANLTAADELAISVWAPFSGTNHGSIAAATGYSIIFSEGNTTTYMGGAGAYKVISGGNGATHSAAWTWTSNADGVSAVIANFIPAAGGGGYTLTAGQGSYALTGQSVGLRIARRMTAAQGSYSLTGQPAGLKRSYPLVASQGSYTLTGQAAGLRIARRIVAAQGSYALSGQSLTLRLARQLSAGQGGYALTGQTVALRIARRLAAGQGSYALTGQAVTLTYSGSGNKTLVAGQGSYALTGQDVALRLARRMTAAQGAYSLAGQAAALRAARRIAADAGSYALTGQAASLRLTRRMVAAPGSYALSGVAAGLMVARRIAIASGGYSLAGQDVSIRLQRRLVAAPGSYALAGSDVVLRYSNVPDLVPAAERTWVIAARIRSHTVDRSRKWIVPKGLRNWTPES